MIGDGCRHQRDPLACPYCSMLDKRDNPYYTDNTPSPRYGQDVYGDYRYPANPPANTFDVNRMESEVVRLQDEVRRLGLLVTKLISIFAPGEKIT